MLECVCRVSRRVTRSDSRFLGFGRPFDLGPDPAVTQMGPDAAPHAAAAFPADKGRSDADRDGGC